MKTIAGSILAGLSLLAEVANEWLHHLFFAVFNIAEGTMLEGGGNFSAPPFYAHPESVQIFIGTRIIIWIFMALGVVMIIWGLLETKTNRRCNGVKGAKQASVLALDAIRETDTILKRLGKNNG